MCMGRHSHPDELESELAPTDVPAAAADVAPAPARPHTTPVADLQFLLRRPRLLVASVFAALAPFGVYFTVMIGLHKMYDWALFLGAPLVLGGVLLGALLDRAYARQASGPRPVRAVTAPASAVPVTLGSRSIEGARP
jgi:hypothetical protein